MCEPDVEAAWSEEIKRRTAEVDAGIVELIPWEKFALNCSARWLPQVYRSLDPNAAASRAGSRSASVPAC